MTLTTDVGAGLVWVKGQAVPTPQKIAQLLGLLEENRGQLVTHDDIESALEITTHTRNAYLARARSLASMADLRIRNVKGQGVVLEEIPKEVAA